MSKKTARVEHERIPEMREEFFSKFRDYNRELEKILEKKDFSKDTKNLLLSMFYKLEVSYNDYFIVKRKSKTKQEYLENILNNIQQCNMIELIEPSNEHFKEFQKNKLYKINFKLKKIKVLANEYAILSAVLELNNFEIRLGEEYNLIRNSMPYLLNTAYEMENLEVLRDFNAWSWNTQVSEIKDVSINLIYQILKIILNVDIFSLMQKENGYVDVIEIIEQNLKNNYDNKVIEELMQIVFKLSIIIYIKKSENEKKRLKEEKEVIQVELEEIKNKKLYIEKINADKKQLVNELKQHDLIMNNRELLTKEYEKRNKQLSEYNKIFSISHLVEKMQREREKLLDKIALCNQKMEPQTYVNNKNKLQKDFNLLKDINFDKKNLIEKYIIQLQKLFLQRLFLTKIENSKTKNDLIDCMYELRYYLFLPFTKERMVQDEKAFKTDVEHVKEILIKKLYEYKLINTISSNEENDIKIVKNIFALRMINLEDAYIELRKKEDKFLIIIYDEKETIETQIQINLEFNKKDKIKLNRKVKLFI